MCIHRLRSELTLLSGLIASGVILTVGAAFYLSGEYADTWLALILSANFFAMFAFILASPWPVQRAGRMRVFLGLLILNLLALLAIPPHFDIYLILFFVLSVTAASSFEEREWRWWIVSFAVITILVFWVQEGSIQGLLPAFIYIAGFYFFAIFARSLTEAREAEAEIKRLYEQLQAYSQQAEELAVMDERTRMAREMHDTVGHRLAVSAVQLEVAQKLIDRDPQRAKEVTSVVREQVLAALDELRRTVAALRSPVEEGLALSTSLQRLVVSFQQATGVEVTLTLSDDLPDDIPPPQRKAIYRAAQETLTNVHKHARASHVWMQLSRAGDRLTLVVEDDGQGVSPDAAAQAAGFGLLGLQERAQRLGGDFRLEPRQPRGSRAIFTIALRDDSSDRERNVVKSAP